jgi:aspartyl-tRNA(Asn)/glutamyl-tRNA(Gln) amidotransferase subunit B
VDYNRAGVPLLEIVTEPHIHSAEEAEAYARKLRAILQYLGVNDGDMSKGVLRVEPNISVRRDDDTDYRTRTEIKNLNSIRSLFRATKAEIERQIHIWERGEEVKQATLGWDEAKQRLVVQRYKERADEYRYFPEPDLPVLEISREWVESVGARLPELPDAKRDRFINILGLNRYDASVLVADQAVASYFEDVLAAGANAKSAANWITGGLFSLMNRDGVERDDITSTKISPANLAALVKLVESGTLNKGTATAVLNDMWETGSDPSHIVEAKGLAQVSDTGAISEAVAQVLAGNAAMVEEYLAGKDKLFGALIGLVMKQMAGKGNPQGVKDELARQLAAKKG